MRETVTAQQDALVPHLPPLQNPEYLLFDDLRLFRIVPSAVVHKADNRPQASAQSFSILIPGMLVNFACKYMRKIYASYCNTSNALCLPYVPIFLFSAPFIQRYPSQESFVRRTAAFVPSRAENSPLLYAEAHCE